MSMRAASMVLVVSVLGIAGCCCPLTPPSQGTTTITPVTPSTPTTPTTPTIPGTPSGPTGSGPGPIEIAPGGNGPYQVNVGGSNVWPPRGPGCDRLVACCDAAGQLNSALNLSCRLSVARQPVDCNAALTTVRNMINEMHLAQPAACAP